MKKDTFLKEYAQRLSDENLKFVSGHLNQRLAGDLSEVLNFFSNNNDMDRWLDSAKSGWELYDMLDMIHKIVDAEYSKRFGEAA